MTADTIKMLLSPNKFSAADTLTPSVTVSPLHTRNAGDQYSASLCFYFPHIDLKKRVSGRQQQHFHPANIGDFPDTLWCQPVSAGVSRKEFPHE